MRPPAVAVPLGKGDYRGLSDYLPVGEISHVWQTTNGLSGNSKLGRLATDVLADETDGRSPKTLAYPFYLVHPLLTDLL
jgi:hypothetical protein